MDRGAASALPVAPVFTPADALPPYEWASARRVALAGVGLLAAAAALGLVATAIDAPPEWWGHGLRLVLVLAGALTAGSAVSMRPDLWQAWALGCAAATLAVVGTPAHWDSFRLLFGVMAAVAGVWAALRLGPARFRLPVLSALVLFHFGGIFLATTTPPTTPWLTEQVFVRVYNPYLQFLYLRNAYHFYSPEPGPASVLVFLLKTDTGATDPQTGLPKYTTRWVVMPRRPADVKDPLGLTYFRRLSITEQVARSAPGLALPTNYFEKSDVLQRRNAVNIPPPRGRDEVVVQYRLPQSDVARYVLPSYASHVILENTADKNEARRTTVKVYRLEHNVMSVEEFANPRKLEGVNSNPFHPVTYRPYFLGEFNAAGDLVDPQEPMLYWQVPLVPRARGPKDPEYRRDFIDYLSIHALADTLNLSVDEVDDPKYRDRVFNWDLLH